MKDEGRRIEAVVDILVEGDAMINFKQTPRLKGTVDNLCCFDAVKGKAMKNLLGK